MSIARFISPRPPNIKFLRADVLGPLPFEAESFDIIHARFVFLHVRLLFIILYFFHSIIVHNYCNKLKEVSSVILRLTSLLAPSGHFLIEDGDLTANMDGFTPVMQAAMRTFTNFVQSRGQDPAMGKRAAGYLKDAGAFEEEEISVKLVSIPLNPKPEDGEQTTNIYPQSSISLMVFTRMFSSMSFNRFLESTLARLGRTMQASFMKVMATTRDVPGLRDLYDEDMRRGWFEDVTKPDWSYDYRVYCG